MYAMRKEKEIMRKTVEVSFEQRAKAKAARAEPEKVDLPTNIPDMEPVPPQPRPRPWYRPW
jgi:putative transposon-encoded protein